MRNALSNSGVLAASALLLSQSVLAGDLLVRLKAVSAMPAASGISGVKTKSATGPEFDLVYLVAPKVAVEFSSAGYNNAVNYNDVNFGKINQVSNSLTALYRLPADVNFNWYAGAGMNHTHFYDNGLVNGTATKADHFGPVLQLGVDFKPNETFLLNLDLKKTFASTDIKLPGSNQTSSLKLEPWVIGIGVGFKIYP